MYVIIILLLLLRELPPTTSLQVLTPTATKTISWTYPRQRFDSSFPLQGETARALQPIQTPLPLMLRTNYPQ